VRCRAPAAPWAGFVKRPPIRPTEPSASVAASHRRNSARPRPPLTSPRPSLPPRPPPLSPSPSRPSTARSAVTLDSALGARLLSRPSSARSSLGRSAESVSRLEQRRRAYLANHHADESWQGLRRADVRKEVPGDEPGTDDAVARGLQMGEATHHARASPALFPGPCLGSATRLQSDTNRKLPEAGRLGVPIPLSAPPPRPRCGPRVVAGNTIITSRPSTVLQGGVRHRPRSVPFATSSAAWTTRQQHQPNVAMKATSQNLTNAPLLIDDATAR